MQEQSGCTKMNASRLVIEDGMWGVKGSWGLRYINAVSTTTQGPYPQS